MATALKMTADEFLHYAAAHGRCELITGEVRRLSPAGGRRGNIGARLLGLLFAFVEEQAIHGELFTTETGFRLKGGDASTVRAPDLAFIAGERAAAANEPGFISVTPDLVAEIILPSDTVIDVNDKLAWWLRHGTKLVWVLDPENRAVTAFRADGSARMVTREQVLDGGDVLPGFQLPLAELFR